MLSSFVINLAETFPWQLLLNNLQHLLLIDLIIFSFAFYKHTRQYVCDFVWMLITVSVSICHTQRNTLSTIQDCIMMSLTRMHSSRMRTGRSLTVCRSLLPRGGVVCSQGVCLLQGVSALGGGVCSWRGVLLQGVSAPGGCLLLEGVFALGGVCSGGCLLPGDVCSWGVSALGGVSAHRGCVCSRGCLLQGVSAPGQCVSALGGVCSGGVCCWGCLLLGGVVSQHALRQTPPCEQNDRQV